MAENGQNGEWDTVLAKRLQKKRRTDVHRSGDARARSERSDEPADAGGGGDQSAKETLLWSSRGGSPGAASGGTPGGGSAGVLDPRDEKKAIDILLRRRGPVGGGKILALGAVAALVAAVGVLVGTGGPSAERRPQLVDDLAPPDEDEGPPAGTAGTAGAGGSEKPEERLPTFHARPPRPGEARPPRRTEWKELGGPLVDLDASPPLR